MQAFRAPINFGAMKKIATSVPAFYCIIRRS